MVLGKFEKKVSVKNRIFSFSLLSQDYDENQNHIRLIKFVLSLIVLHTHCYMFLQGNMLNDPFKIILHIRWGDLGTTTLFFLISGFVLAQSIQRSDTLFQFMKKRLLKIYPNVITANLILIFCAFLISNVNFKDYFFSPSVKHFLFQNSVLIKDIKQRIGLGVFNTNPLPGILNGQWWTLKWTIFTYLLASLLFYPIKIISSKIYFNLFFLFTLIYLSFLNQENTSFFSTIFSFFLTGIFFYLNKEKIPFNTLMVILALIFYIIIYNTNFIYFFSPFLKGYILLYAATHFNNFLPRFNLYKDYSFGIYLYHVFFIQFFIFKGVNSIPLLFFLSLVASLFCAFLSNYVLDYINLKSDKILKFMGFNNQ
jgi:peptidoglycan/LPS O-acetylase OafA/YrhL